HVLLDNMSTGNFLRHTLHLNTLAFRPQMALPVRARQVLSMIQIA
ncbi:unnamed protein product, partial [marine sediment metagenome]